MKLILMVNIAPLAVMTLCGFTGPGKSAGFLTEPLNDSLWQKSVWISAPDAAVVTDLIEGAHERAADGASWFLSDVRNTRKVVSAKWMTSGLGVYHLFVNGVPVGTEALKPGFTHWQKTKRSFTYDLDDVLLKDAGAVNHLAVQVTPGWWADKIVSPAGAVGMRGKKPAFRGVLELVYDDGTKKYFGTSTAGWKAGVGGPVRHAAIFDGEDYDARVPRPTDATALGTPEINNEFWGEILPTDGAEVYYRRDLVMHPKEAYVWKGITGADSLHQGSVKVLRCYAPGKKMKLRKGETLVVDFGQNAAAVPLFDFKASKGVTLECLPGEILNDGNGAFSRGMDGPEGSVHRSNLRERQLGIRMRYTFADSKPVTYMPECTFYGYRYVSVTADGDVEISALESVPVTSVAQGHETGRITTGHDMVNRLISNSYWGMLSNYLSVPTDCPQRDERLGWMADTQVFAETGTYFANTSRFFHKWLRDVRDTQRASGAYAGVAPEAQYGSDEIMRLGWSDAGIIVPWVVWKQFDDKSIVNEHWASMEKYMDHIAANEYDHCRLAPENANYEWGDWLSYEPLESFSFKHTGIDCNGNRYVLPEAIDYWNYLCACYWVMDSRMMADMARATGRDAAKYEEMERHARRRIAENFIAENGRFITPVLNTMQTPALFALYNGLVKGQARENMIERLRNNFAEHGNTLQTGFLGTSILLSTLSDNGMADIAYELLLQHNHPSWFYSIDNGATTLWERWNSYTKEHGMGPQAMNSFNHYAYGAVSGWMWKTMAGINSDTRQPGFRNIVMKPVPDRRIGYVTAEYPTPNGVVKSAWKYDGDLWKWDFTIPEGCTADVTLPDSSVPVKYKAGSHHVELKLP